MTCKDCFHFGVCIDYTTLKESEYAQNFDGAEILCDHFRRRSDFVLLMKGEWIKAECSEKDGDSNCSLCGHFDWSDCNFCSQCGADMRKGVM